MDHQDKFRLESLIVFFICIGLVIVVATRNISYYNSDALPDYKFPNNNFSKYICLNTSYNGSSAICHIDDIREVS